MSTSIVLVTSLMLVSSQYGTPFWRLAMMPAPIQDHSGTPPLHSAPSSLPVCISLQREQLEDEHALGFSVRWSVVVLPAAAMLAGPLWAPLALIPPVARLGARVRAWQRLAQHADVRAAIRPALDARDASDGDNIGHVSPATSSFTMAMRRLRSVALDVTMVWLVCWALAGWLRPWEQSRLIQQLWSISPVIVLTGTLVVVLLTLADRDARQRPLLHALTRRAGLAWRELLRTFL